VTVGVCAVDGLKQQQQSNPVMTDEGISLARLVVFFSCCAMAVNCVQFVIEFALRHSAVCCWWRKLMLQVQISLNVEVSTSGTWLKPLDGETAFVM